MSIESTRAVIMKYIASNHTDLSMMAPDVVFTHMATGDEHRGPDAVAAMLHFVYHVAFDAQVQARNAHVVQPIDIVPHDLGADRGLLGDGEIGRARRRDQHHALAALDGQPAFDDAGLGMEGGVRHDAPDRLEGLRRGPCHQQRMPAPDDGAGDAGDLIGGLGLPEHHLREPLTDRPVVVNPGVAQVLERVGSGLFRQHFRGLGRQIAALHGEEQLAPRERPPGSAIHLIFQGFRFDSVTSRSLKCLIVLPVERPIL